MRKRFFHLERAGILCLGLVWASLAAAEERVPPQAVREFARLQALLKPQPGESPWRDIGWFTNVTEARERAAAEGKPLVIFTAADGSPLSRT